MSGESLLLYQLLCVEGMKQFPDACDAIQLSVTQAKEAEASVKLLRSAGQSLTITMHHDIQRAIVACDSLPAPGKTDSPSKYRIPQFMSLSRLSLTK